MLVVKNPPANAGDIREEGLIPGSGRSPRGGHGNPLQDSCLENPMDRGAWWSIGSQSQTRLKQLSTQAISYKLSISWLNITVGEGNGTPLPVLLPGKSHGRRSLVGCSPWGPEESVATEQLHFHFSLSRIGEGNGNPLQCSCLENPRDGGPPSMESHRVGHDWSDLAAAAANIIKIDTPL